MKEQKRPSYGQHGVNRPQAIIEEKANELAAPVGLTRLVALVRGLVGAVVTEAQPHQSHRTAESRAAGLPHRKYPAKATASARTDRALVGFVNVARLICACSYHFVIAVWRAKDAESRQKGHMKKVTCIATSLAMFTTAIAGTPAQLNPEQPRPKAMYAPRPQYPEEARRKHIEGSGVFVLHVHRGAVTKVDIYRSTGSAILDNAAVSAMRQWRFQPTNTPVLVPVPQEFRLH